MKELLKDLKKELYSKAMPGKLLNDLMDEKLKELASRYEHNSDALWLGTYLADIRIVEARKQGNHMLHVPMAVEYAKEIFEKHDIDPKTQEIVLEIIESHHGGKEQKHIESKLFTNADCFKFLEPRGALHLFGAYYIRTNENFEESMQAMMFKAKEKYELVDLDEETKKEATDLYEHLKWIFDRVGVEEKTPEIYKGK